MLRLALLLAAALLPACSQAVSAVPGTPAPGHVAATFKLEAEPTCAGCVARITEAVGPIAGVSSVEVTVGNPTLRVWHDPAQSPEQSILEALDKSGEKASLVR
jgi:copper chaperone CopZ